MADVNITNCIAHPKKCSIPASQTSVSFHAADATYTLFFKNPATFGEASATIPQSGSPTSLPVKSPQSTGYCISGPGCPSSPPCPPPPGAPGDDGDPYEITIGSVEPLKRKPKVKATAKRAADMKAKAKGKAKPKPKAPPKKKAAVKAKGIAKKKPAAKAKKKR